MPLSLLSNRDSYALVGIAGSTFVDEMLPLGVKNRLFRYMFRVFQIDSMHTL